MKKFILFVASLAMVVGMQAQPTHKFLQKQLNRYSNCKSVAITKRNGDAMLYGSCGWKATQCPIEFTRLLFELSEVKTSIHDIHLSELGRWIILYGDNETYSDLLYENLKIKISECQADQEEITTVTFNDGGDWIVITKKAISASSDDLMGWLTDGCDKYGQLWTACLTDDAAIAIYEFGFKYWGNVPEDLKDALRACKSDVYTVKMAGKSWFFKCTDGYNCYSL